MNLMKPLLTAVIILMTTAVFAQQKTEFFKVYGNCGMCKKRIEAAAAINGVTKADWNKDTKMMTVVFDAGKTNTDSIQQKVTAVGHDTEKYPADNKVYENLPGCCLYERKKAPEKEDHSKHKH